MGCRNGYGSAAFRLQKRRGGPTLRVRSPFELMLLPLQPEGCAPTAEVAPGTHLAHR
jgi:hypothetical protein